MNPDRKSIGAIILLLLVAVSALKLWPDSTQSPHAGIKLPKGPAIILIRGDNSPSCKIIHGLVEQAAERYSNRIEVIQTDWSPDNPLIKHYQIRFLPAVVFIGSDGKEVGRIIGESKAVQDQLAQALSQADALLE